MDLIGTHLPLRDGYTLDRQIAAGGMSILYHGVDGNGAEIAVKTMHPETEARYFPYQASIIRHDADVVMSLKHQNIPKGIELFGFAIPIFAMQYVEGQTFRPSSRNKLRVLADIASALDYIHSLGIVHCDVQPSNILVADDRAYLIDFGLSRWIASRRISCSKELVASRKTYMAPEQVIEAEVDELSDQYSLAAVAHEILSGAYYPWTGVRIGIQQPHPPGHGAELHGALKRALGPRDTRFASCKEFVNALIAETKSQNA